MTEKIKQDCPLCASSADYQLIDYGKYKQFTCRDCQVVQISLRAERLLLQAPQQWRDGYAQKAQQAPEDHVLVIRVPSPSQEPNGGATPALSGTFVKAEACSDASSEL